VKHLPIRRAQLVPAKILMQQPAAPKEFWPGGLPRFSTPASGPLWFVIPSLSTSQRCFFLDLSHHSREA